MSGLATAALNRTASFLRRGLARGARLAEGIEKRTDRHSIVSEDRDVSFGEVYYGGYLPLNLVPLTVTPPLSGRSGKVTLFLPSLRASSFFGGAATALIVAGKLAVRLGKGLRIVESVHGTGDTSGLGGFFLESQIAIRSEDVEVVDLTKRRYNRPLSLDVHPDDEFVVSAWWDAHVLAKLSLPRPFVYLIQDYEPIFYANSDRYVLAENTYRGEEFVPLCNTKLMRDFLFERYPHVAREARWFEPAVSIRKYGVCRRPEGVRKIFLYGRPSVERNLFSLALLALERLFSSGNLDKDGWRVVMAGQDGVPDVILSSGVRVENLGKLSLEEYHKLSLEVDLAISLMMAPHPNYPTLELASIGASVVTTRYANKQDLSCYSKNILMADLTVEDIVATVAQAALVPYETRLSNADESNIGGDWEVALATSLDDIAASLRG